MAKDSDSPSWGGHAHDLLVIGVVSLLMGIWCLLVMVFKAVRWGVMLPVRAVRWSLGVIG